VSGEVLHEWIEREYEKRNSVNKMAYWVILDEQLLQLLILCEYSLTSSYQFIPWVTY